MTTTLINLTPHIVNIIGVDGVINLPSEGAARVARVAETRVPLAPLTLPTGEVIAVTAPSYGEVTGLPHPADGVVYVVSALVRAALPARADLASPGPLVRGADGQPTGCQGLSMSMVSPTPSAPTTVEAVVAKLRSIAAGEVKAGHHDADWGQLCMGENLLAQVAVLEAAVASAVAAAVAAERAAIVAHLDRAATAAGSWDIYGVVGDIAAGRHRDRADA